MTERVEVNGIIYLVGSYARKDSPLPFTVREATELEEAEIKRRREIDRRVDRTDDDD